MWTMVRGAVVGLVAVIVLNTGVAAAGQTPADRDAVLEQLRTSIDSTVLGASLRWTDHDRSLGGECGYFSMRCLERITVAAPVHGDRRARLCQCVSDRTPNPTARASDQRGPAREIKRHPSHLQDRRSNNDLAVDFDLAHRP